MACLKERHWTADALTKLAGLTSALVETLEKAEGNELLESAIPQLQQGLTAVCPESLIGPPKPPKNGK
jgi:hypothetical protein